VPAVFPQSATISQRPPQWATIGTFTNGRFHHILTGTEFSMPTEWKLSFQGQSSGGGEAVAFINRLSGDPSVPMVEAFV
jgi:hypothetical protein